VDLKTLGVLLNESFVTAAIPFTDCVKSIQLMQRVNFAASWIERVASMATGTFDF
jgi:hypothetical protein